MHYRILLSIQDAFPDSVSEMKMVKNAWKKANDLSGLQAFAITPDISKIVRYYFFTHFSSHVPVQIKARGSQLQSEIKNKTTPLVESIYGFESGQNRKLIMANRHLAEELKCERFSLSGKTYLLI